MRRAWPLAALTLLLLSAPYVEARDWTEKQVQEILAERIDRHHKSVGLAVGWIDAEGSFVVGYGKLAADDPRVPDGTTVYEIGSITKVFTGILLADMVARGEVELNEPVQKSLPDTVTMPRDGETEISLYHLTTHTSGLPRMPSNFSPADPGNPYADYSVEQMYEFLGEASLAGPPGENASYSNLGVGLLGHVLALRAGMSYEALVRERIAGPLGMKDTVIVLTPALEKRLAQGHTAELEPTPNWDMPTVAGAGALRSTVDDMLIFLAANLGLKKSSISKAMETSHEAQEPFSGLEIGYGWVLQPAEGGTIHWHNGGTGGYRTFAGFNKERSGRCRRPVERQHLRGRHRSAPAGLDDPALRIQDGRRRREGRGRGVRRLRRELPAETGDGAHDHPRRLTLLRPADGTEQARGVSRVRHEVLRHRDPGRDQLPP